MLEGARVGPHLHLLQPLQQARDVGHLAHGKACGACAACGEACGCACSLNRRSAGLLWCEGEGGQVSAGAGRQQFHGWLLRCMFGAEVLHYGEVATAHGRALQDKRKKV